MNKLILKIFQHLIPIIFKSNNNSLIEDKQIRKKKDKYLCNDIKLKSNLHKKFHEKQYSTAKWIPSFPFRICSRSPRVGGPLSQSLAMIPPTMHGHEFNQPLSRVVMVRKTDQRTFSKGRRGGEPLLETVTRETVELFNGGRAERKYTSETRDIVTPKSNRYVYLCTYVRHFLLITWIEREKRGERKPDFLQNANEVVRSTRVRKKRCFPPMYYT